MHIIHDSLEIRPLRRGAADEEAAVLRVYQQCEDFLALGPVATASMEMVQADFRLSQEMGGVFCGIYDRSITRPDSVEMLGIVDFVLRGYKGDPETGYISLLMISAPYRSHGLGERVVELVEKAMAQEGHVLRIEAGVQVNNPSAIRFWQRMGFCITSGPILHEDQTTAYDLEKVIIPHFP